MRLIPDAGLSRLSEYNHSHGPDGRFSSGGFGGPADAGSGGGPTVNKNSMWHSQRWANQGELKKKLAMYAGWHKDVSSGNHGAGQPKGFADTRTQAELDAERTKFETEDKPVLLQQYAQHMTDIQDALQSLKAYRASKAATQKSAGQALETSRPMHNGVELTPGVLAGKSIDQLAGIVSSNWRQVSPKGVNYAAKPYLDAMRSMNSIKDNYGADSGSGIVAYFLGNATSWKGSVAKAVKAELNKRLKGS